MTAEARLARLRRIRSAQEARGPGPGARNLGPGSRRLSNTRMAARTGRKSPWVRLSSWRHAGQSRTDRPAAAAQRPTALALASRGSARNGVQRGACGFMRGRFSQRARPEARRRWLRPAASSAAGPGARLAPAQDDEAEAADGAQHREPGRHLGDLLAVYLGRGGL